MPEKLHFRVTDFDSKKAQDKERWSQAATSRPQSPAMRGFSRLMTGAPCRPPKVTGSPILVHLATGEPRRCAIPQVVAVKEQTSGTVAKAPFAPYSRDCELFDNFLL